MPAWTIHQSDKSLFIAGGADAKYEIELESSEPSFFSTLKSSSHFSRNELNPPDQRVLEELVLAEIVAPILKKSQVLKVRLMGDGGGIVLTSDKTLSVMEGNQPYDLALIVRVGSTYAALLGQLNYQDLTTPHLLVDIAFHHTASIGPLVFPGETSCIACLQGRVSTRWGDEMPPESPKVATSYGTLVTELVKAELGRIAQGDTGLTNKTVTWNFQDRTIKENQLLKVPLCPICSQNEIDHTGALALPWRKDESTSNAV